MVFNSYSFIFLFLPITFMVFFLLGKYAPKKSATLWLVLASFFFYGWWDYKYVPLLFSSIVFNYLIGQQLEKRPGYKPWLIFGISCNILLLGYFKYTDFLLSTLNKLAGTGLNLPHIVLPLGISFFTFTQTAYLIDAYRGNTKNESFLTYCEFVTIFPHLLAGPIIDHKKMIPQFIADKTFQIDWHNIAAGISLFTMGLFKKVIIADMLSPWVKGAFTNTATLTFLEAWIGAIAYTFQIYFDFSGYSEMAVGLALMFNLKFPVNFNSPLQATSIIDFWRRWHMTLGEWVREYLYIPMGGNRQGEFKKMRNLFVSMLLIGIWHGAGWTFMLWGFLHGVLLVINHQWRRLNITFPRFFSWMLTFLCIVTTCAIFRAETLNDAWNVLKAMADISNFALPANTKWETALAGYGIKFVLWHIPKVMHQSILILIALTIVLTNTKNPVEWMKSFKSNWKWLVIILGMLLYTLNGINTYTEFLYFQF